MATVKMFSINNPKFLAFSLLLLNSTMSHANLRAPLNIHRSPSSTLYQIADAQVLGENLSVECNWQTCEVAVKYLIETDKPLAATVDFIVPKEVSVSAKVGENSVSMQKKALPVSQDPREQDNELETFSQGKNQPLFKAEFPLNVGKGRHEIFITYQQPLALKEKGYGYFSEGYYVGLFQYELWPLNEWKVNKDFKLDLHLNVSTETNWWESLFSDASIQCFTVKFKPCEGQSSENRLCKVAKPLASSKDSTQLSIQEQLVAPLPDRLFCEISPDKFF